MPEAQKKKKVDAKNQAEEVRTASAIRKERKGNNTPYIIASVVVVAVLVLVGIAYYQQYYAPFQRVIITVDKTQIRMGYFLERARLSGSGGMGELQTLTNEVLIKQGVAQYGIAVTPKDVDAELRKTAAGSDNVTVSDAEFKEWYRQLLNNNKMTDKRYREMITNQLLASRLQDYLGSGIPSVLPTDHVYGIFVGSYDEALQAKQRVEAGEDFSKVAEDVSIDGPSRDKGGELEWVPKGAMALNLDPFTLKVGEVSDPLADASDPSQAPTSYYVLMVKETQDRPIDPSFLPELKNKAMQDWLNAETGKHTVKWKYNSEIDAWVNWQLTKVNPAPTTTPSGSGR